jgi:cation/acetate symporter
MQYPLAIRADTTLAMNNLTDEIRTLKLRLDEPNLNQNEIDSLTSKISKARVNLQANKDKFDATGTQTTSLVGLEKPLISLKNPGIISVPLGALFLVLGSLLYRRRIDADEKWRALVFRRDSGVGVEDAVNH